MPDLRRAALIGAALLLGLLPGAGPADAAEPFDLPAGEALEWLLERNRGYLNAQADLEKARLEVIEAGSAALPQLEAKATGTRLGNIQSFRFDSLDLATAAEDNYAFSLGASQLLFSGSVFSAIGVARSYRGFAEAELRRHREGLVREFLAGYSSLALLDELVALNGEMVERTRERFEDARLLAGIGSLSRFDLLRSEVEYMNTIPELREAENLAAQAESALRLMLDLEPGAVVTTREFDLACAELEGTFPGLLNAPDPSSDERRIEGLSALALEHRPETAMAVHGIEGYRRAVNVYRSQHLPTLAAFANWERANQWDLFSQDDLWNNSWNAGLQLSLPLFNGFRTTSQVRKGQQDLLKARQDESALHDAIRLEVRTAYDELQRRLLDHAAWSRNAEAAQEGFEIARTRRENGAGSELELRDARTAMKAARVNQARARHELLTARLDLLHALGLLDRTEVIDR
jgi:outer membrane protein